MREAYKTIWVYEDTHKMFREFVEDLTKKTNAPRPVSANDAVKYLLEHVA